MASGIYRIRNTVNDKCYIGSAVDLSKRKRGHFQQWTKDKAVNSKLLNAVRKYGAASFAFEIVEYCEPSELLRREEFWIQALNVCQDGYNIRTLPNSNLGIHFPGDKISDALKGRVFSSEHCRNISLAKKGIQPSEKERQRLAAIHEANKGQSHSQEHRSKISASLKGKIVSSETRAKLALVRRKLSDQNIRDILALLAEGVPHRAIRLQFQISERTCCSIRKGDGRYAKFKAELNSSKTTKPV